MADYMVAGVVDGKRVGNGCLVRRGSENAVKRAHSCIYKGFVERQNRRRKSSIKSTIFLPNCRCRDGVLASQGQFSRFPSLKTESPQCAEFTAIGLRRFAFNAFKCKAHLN